MQLQDSGPALIYWALRGYQISQLLKSAHELDFFSKIDPQGSTPEQLAAKIGCSVRGIRILCKALASIGFLRKQSDRYHATPLAATYFDRRSRAYIGDALDFLMGDRMRTAFDELTKTIRSGKPRVATEDVFHKEHPFWVEFARKMTPVQMNTAEKVAELLACHGLTGGRVLEVACGGSPFGMALARRCPAVQIVALDRPAVLQVAKEFVEKAGLSNRYEFLPGSAFDAELGRDYAAILVPNFFHHFDPQTNIALMQRFRDALKPDGWLVIIDYIPDETDTNPPEAAFFSLVMLATTESGDAYSVVTYRQMCRQAGFREVEHLRLPQGPHSVLLAKT